MAYFISGDPRVFPDQITKEGLEPWTVSKLYWGAFPRSRFAGFAEMAEKSGLDVGVPIKEFLKRAQPDEVITTRIDVSSYVDLKLNALYCHASQMNPNSIFSKIPIEIRKEGMKVETLIRAESRIVITEPETDLFTTGDEFIEEAYRRQEGHIAWVETADNPTDPVESFASVGPSL